MKKTNLILRCILLIAILLVANEAIAERKISQRMTKDSLTITTSTWQEGPSKRMAQSAYPVKLRVLGRSLRITSKHEQVLPIYTQGGTLYLAMQLTPGVNWLNGLPSGRYRINNRTIRIK